MLPAVVAVVADIQRETMQELVEALDMQGLSRVVQDQVIRMTTL
jgi:hypothetical protein